MSEVRGQNALARDYQGAKDALARRLPNHTLSDLLIPLSGAIDLAEGRQPGHAQRVAYIAMAVADAIGLEAEDRLAACYAGLMHDLGVIMAGASLADRAHTDERVMFSSLPLLTPEEIAVGVSETPELIVDRIVDHAVHGSRTARDFGLPEETVRGISSHHESWDGTGYPHGLAGENIPVIGRAVALADQLESMIGQTTPLQARRNFSYWITNMAGTLADPSMVVALRDIAGGDRFWLGLFGADMPHELMQQCSRLRESKRPRVLTLSDAFAHLVDSRFEFTSGVSRRVAGYMEEFGRKMELSDPHLKLLRCAALLHDVGQLAVTERIMAKPGILSVDELDVLRLHPMYSSQIVAGMSGLEVVAEWIAAHHERPDGKGYPDGLTLDEIPLEARMMAIADSYVAITSDRPHRPAVSGAEASKRLRSAAGTQLDADLLDFFLTNVVR